MSPPRWLTTLFYAHSILILFWSVSPLDRRLFPFFLPLQSLRGAVGLTHRRRDVLWPSASRGEELAEADIAPYYRILDRSSYLPNLRSRRGQVSAQYFVRVP